MTTSTNTVSLPRAPRSSFRLERAELLKLRKNRSVSIPATLLTVGAMIVMYVSVELYHLFSPSTVGPAGGTSNFGDAVFLMGQLAATISALLVGSSAATQDMSSGTLRDLISTGRSRIRLYGARLVGGVSLLAPLMIVAYGVAALFCVIFASGESTPSTSLFLKGGLWVLLCAVATYLISFGLGSLTGSRTATISILVAYLLPVQGILVHIDALGRVRDALLSVATGGLTPFPAPQGNEAIPISHTTSLIVLAVWVLAFSGLGLWRVRTRDA